MCHWQATREQGQKQGHCHLWLTVLLIFTVRGSKAYALIFPPLKKSSLSFSGYLNGFFPLLCQVFATVTLTEFITDQPVNVANLSLPTLITPHHPSLLFCSPQHCHHLTSIIIIHVFVYLYPSHNMQGLLPVLFMATYPEPRTVPAS